MTEALLLLTLAMPPQAYLEQSADLPAGIRRVYALDSPDALHGPQFIRPVIFRGEALSALQRRVSLQPSDGLNVSAGERVLTELHVGIIARSALPLQSQADQVGTMGRYVPEPAGMLGAASLRPVQAEDAGPSRREEQAVHVLLGANAFFSVGSRLFTQRCLGESTCYERNKLTRELYTNRPKTGIMVQAASTAIENYLLWRIHDNADKRAWVRAAIVGVLAFNVWNFANDLKVYKQTGRNR